jgi:hypothetical protein
MALVERYLKAQAELYEATLTDDQARATAVLAPFLALHEELAGAIHEMWESDA